MDVQVCTCAHAGTHAEVHGVHSWIPVCTFIRTLLGAFICECNTHTHTHTHTLTHPYTHTHTCMHAYLHASSLYVLEHACTLENFALIFARLCVCAHLCMMLQFCRRSSMHTWVQMLMRACNSVVAHSPIYLQLFMYGPSTHHRG
jgi:hypothetical protein